MSSPHDDAYYPLISEDGLQARVTRLLDRSPWWLLSVLAHGGLALAMWMTAFSTYAEEREIEIHADVEVEEAQPEPEESVERDVFENDMQFDADNVPIDQEQIPEFEDDDRLMRDTNDDQDSIKGLVDAESNGAFEGKFNASPIGLGGGGGGPFGGRFGGNKDRSPHGPSRKTEGAVKIGLTWLARHQNPNGMWSTRKFCANCRKGLCGGKGSSDDYDMGNTGLALLAFLGAGHTHRHGKYKLTVKKALMALKDRQLPNGCFGPQNDDGHWIYNHLIATMAVAEAYGLSHKTPLLRGMAQRAVDYAVASRNPQLGWRYGERPGDNDTSCTGWAVLALKSARLSGLHVPEEAFEGARSWFKKVTDESSYRAGYTTRGDSGARLADARAFLPGEAMTAASVVSLIFMGANRNDPAVIGGGRRMKQALPRWDVRAGTIDMYYWYYGSLAMHQLGGSFWKAWNPAMKAALVPTQRRKGCLNGSWDPVGAWGAAGGRVYATAINTLTLEVYYRYACVLQKK